MTQIAKNLNYFRTVKNSSDLNFFDFERFNKVLSYLELPFFFDSKLNNFYRFEGSIYNFTYETTYRNFSVDVNLGLKVKTKLLISMFLQPNQPQLVDRKITPQYSFLFNNGFSFAKHMGEYPISSFNDYFPTLTKEQANFIYPLSDFAMEVASSRNRFNRVAKANLNDLDTFISTFNPNWDNLNVYLSHRSLNFSNNLAVVNDNLRTFSFLVASLDSFKILHPQFFSKHLQLKKAKVQLRNLRVANMFDLNNQPYYFYFFSFFTKKLNRFFFKNINIFKKYHQVVKSFFYFIKNHYRYTVKTLITHVKPFLIKILRAKILLSSLKSAKNSHTFAFKHFFKYITVLNLNSQRDFALLDKPRRTDHLAKIVYRSLYNLNNSTLTYLKTSRLVAKDVKKCYHYRSIHHLPAEIFSSTSQFGYAPFSSIHYTTFYKNFRTNHYAERSVKSYQNFLKFFSELLLSMLKRNFVSHVLTNYNYNPRYLIYRYFSIYRLLFPLILKRWVLSKKYFFRALGSTKFSRLLSYFKAKTNYFRYKKKTDISIKNKKLLDPWRRKKIEISHRRKPRVFEKKPVIHSNRRHRYYSTSSTIVHENFFSFLHVFFKIISYRFTYTELSLTTVKPNRYFNMFSMSSRNYFNYVLHCLINFYFFFLIKKIRFFFNNSFHVKNYRLLTLLENFSLPFSSSIFTSPVKSIFRFEDFFLRVDFYTFIILKRYLEYFRFFKYNEYLSYNNLQESHYLHFSFHDPIKTSFTFLPSFYIFQRSLFFNEYLIYKISRPIFSPKLQVENNFPSSSLLNFLYVSIKVRRFLEVFFTLFMTYLHSGLCYYFYKILTNAPGSMQRVKEKKIRFVPKLLSSHSSFSSLLSFQSKIMLRKILANDTYFFFENFITGLNFSNPKSFIFNVIQILLNDYIDKLILDNFLEVELENYDETSSYFKIMVAYSYLKFTKSSITTSFSSKKFFFSLKHQLDYFLWLVYKSAYVNSRNGFFYHDIQLFTRKLFLDRFYKQRDLKIFKINIIFNHRFSFNYILAFLFTRDFYLKTLSFFTSFFYSIYIYYAVFNYFTYFQFLNLKFLYKRLNYYKNFNLNHDKKYQFNYFIYE